MCTLPVRPHRRPPPLSAQASAIQAWVVRQQGTTLTPYHIRTTRPGPTSVPGEEVDLQLFTALEQLKDDVGRVAVAEVWRQYSRLVGGSPEGGPLTYANKIRVRAGGGWVEFRGWIGV